jgi:hypothetical protein
VLPVRDGAWRSAAAGALALGAAAVFLAVLLEARPFDTWLFADLAVIWGWQLVFALACGSFGWLLVERGLGLGALPGLEKLAHAFALGFLAFGVGMYAGGYLGLYGPAFAVALPLLLIAGGAPAAWPAARDWWARRAAAGTPLSPAALGATLFGALALAVLYLGLLSPAAVNYDASWNQLVIAQDYAREGRIVPFRADWLKNVPHLGSVVNTWAFLVPGLDPPALRWMMALHDEASVLLFTLVGVAAGVRFLAERGGVRGAWASLFLFPGIFVYDGNLGGAADHFAALFAVPAFLAAARWLASLSHAHAALLGALAAGALLSKLQAVYLLTPLALLAAVRVGLAPRRALPSAALGAATALGLASLHFGKNWLFYGNPLYPLAQGLVPSHPSVPDAELHMDYLTADWQYLPPSGLLDRLVAAFQVSFTFSFDPHYWFGSDVPTFGSLFTLLLPLLLVLGRAPRLWLAAGVGFAAVFAWASTYWLDRHLQTFMPLLAATTGALIVRGFELGRLARLGLSALVGLQLLWGADHAFSGSDRIASALALIQSGAKGEAARRYASFREDYVELGRALPEDAVLMLHTHHVMLGIDRPVLLDWAGFQGLIDYRPLESARELHQRLRELGVTHVAWLPGGTPAPSKQADVLFAALVAGREEESRRFGALRMLPLGGAGPAPSAPLRVLAFGLGGYADGLYPIEALSTLETLPPELQRFARPAVPAPGWPAARRLAERADALVLGRSAFDREAAPPAGFREAARYATHAIHLRAPDSRR